jgi:hypothetical protein
MLETRNSKIAFSDKTFAPFSFWRTSQLQTITHYKVYQ